MARHPAFLSLTVPPTFLGRFLVLRSRGRARPSGKTHRLEKKHRLNRQRLAASASLSAQAGGQAKLQVPPCHSQWQNRPASSHGTRPGSVTRTPAAPGPTEPPTVTRNSSRDLKSIPCFVGPSMVWCDWIT